MGPSLTACLGTLFTTHQHLAGWYHDRAEMEVHQHPSEWYMSCVFQIYNLDTSVSLVQSIIPTIAGTLLNQVPLF
jgi:hypothetical protein